MSRPELGTTPVSWRSFAKINLSLEVLGRREDGFHELRTVFQTVDLYDRLQLALRDGGIRLEVSGADLPHGPDNLAFQAAQAFCDRWAPGVGVHLKLDKRIPVGGGLGGGSSNAATVLMALQHLLGSPAREADLLEEARRLGADVPYFMVGGTALGRGRGDEITPLAELPETELWLATPAEGVSTAEVFSLLDRPRWDGRAVPWELPGPNPRLSDLLRGNDLETVVLERYKNVRRVYNGLIEAGALRLQLSGSGGTVFAQFSKRFEASELRRELPKGCHLFSVRTLGREALRARHREKGGKGNGDY